MKKIILLAAMAGLLLISACDSSVHKSLQPEGAVVKVPLQELEPMKAAFYQVSLDGKQIRFFAVKAGDGKILTALDACDVCYREKKGYEQKGDLMICRNCNLSFPIERIAPSSKGGCNPHFLPSQVEGDKLLISVEELKKGARFFP